MTKRAARLEATPVLSRPTKAVEEENESTNELGRECPGPTERDETHRQSGSRQSLEARPFRVGQRRLTLDRGLRVFSSLREPESFEGKGLEEKSDKPIKSSKACDRCGAGPEFVN